MSAAQRQPPVRIEVPAAGGGPVDVWLLRPGGDAPGPGSTGTSWTVRSILASYGDGDPDRVRIERTAGGKPVLAGHEADVRFNVARAGDAALVAVACGREVGIDVERLREGPWARLPAHVLTADERVSLERASGTARTAALLRYWVRKEALLKAAGVGLSVEPRLVQVTAPWRAPAVRAVPERIGPSGRWALLDVPLAGHVAALAVESVRPRPGGVRSRALAPAGRGRAVG